MLVNKCEKCGHLSIGQRNCPICGTRIKEGNNGKLRNTLILALFYIIIVVLALVLFWGPISLKNGRNILIYATSDGKKLQTQSNEVILDIPVLEGRLALFKKPVYTYFSWQEYQEYFQKLCQTFTRISLNRNTLSAKIPHNFETISLQGNSKRENAIVINGVLMHGCASTIIDPDIKIINYDAFYMCDSLHRVVIPSTVESVLSGSYEKCNNIEFVEICGNTYIDNMAFYDCNKLNKIKISGDATLERGAFDGCNNLRTVSMSKDAFVTIDEEAFRFTESSWPTYTPGLTLLVLPEKFNWHNGDYCINAKYIVFQSSTPTKGHRLPYPYSYPTNSVVIVPKGSKLAYEDNYSLFLSSSERMKFRIQEVSSEMMDQIVSGNYDLGSNKYIENNEEIANETIDSNIILDFLNQVYPNEIVGGGDNFEYNQRTLYTTARFRKYSGEECDYDPLYSTQDCYSADVLPEPRFEKFGDKNGAYIVTWKRYEREEEVRNIVLLGLENGELKIDNILIENEDTLSLLFDYSKPPVPFYN